MDECNTLSKRGGYKRYIDSLILSLKTCRPISLCQSGDQNVSVGCNYTALLMMMLRGKFYVYRLQKRMLKVKRNAILGEMIGNFLCPALLYQLDSAMCGDFRLQL